MCYIAAKEILPKEVIELIQKYVDGEYIYIPRKEDNRQEWGAKTSAREEINERNESIYEKYLKGISRQELAEQYFLSRKSIDRIILKEKSK